MSGTGGRRLGPFEPAAAVALREFTRQHQDPENSQVPCEQHG